MRRGTAWTGSGSSFQAHSVPRSACGHSKSLAWSDQTTQAAFLPSPGVLLPQPPAPNSSPPNPGAGTQVLPSGQLRIIHVSPEDAGNYFCLAQNSAGSAVGKTRLVVQGGTKVDPSEPGALRLLRAPPASAWLWSQVGHVPASMPIPAWLVVLEGIQGTHLPVSHPRSGFRQ